MVAGHPGSVLLKTARPDIENASHYLFKDPVRILAARTLDDIPALFADVDYAVRSGFYVAGLVSYEAGYHFEPASLGGVPFSHALDVPLAWFGVYEAPLVCSAWGREDDLGASGSEGPTGEMQMALSETAQAYGNKVDRIRRYIEEGDIYQANLTMEVHAEWREDPAALFERMLANQPVAYGAFLNLGESAILSASPELFFRRRGSEILVRPMKGTMRRGRDGEEDAALAAWLANDEKNRAENVMIVDLLRNDLGRICQAGSIRVENLFTVERYRELFQMTSTVRGSLLPGVASYTLFRSLFPCGSITGAPKIRAMQIIRELESEPRGVGCGAIGFFAPDDSAVFSVAIRTLTLRHGEVRMRVGSGITYPSDAQAEYDECLLKARFLNRAPLQFELIETLLWHDGYFLLEEHLQRLAASALYFEFECDVDEVRRALAERAASFPAGEHVRVRLTLAPSGAIAVTSEAIAASSEPVTLVMSSEPTHSADRFLRHKTTHRAQYRDAYRKALELGFDEALFRNERGEITECCNHNILIEKDGVLMTPRLDCGLLPGVYRAHLLVTRPEVQESVLALEDLLAADRIFICNSVRGLRTVRAVSRTANGDPCWTAPR